MRFQLPMRAVMIAFNGSFLDRPIHALHLPVRPRMFWFRESMFDAILVATQVEHVRDPLCCWSAAIARRVTELAAVIGQDRVYLVRHRLDQVMYECRRYLPI